MNLVDINHTGKQMCSNRVQGPRGGGNAVERVDYARSRADPVTGCGALMRGTMRISGGDGR